MSYLLTLPDQTEETHNDLTTAIYKTIDILENQMNPTMQAMLKDIDMTKSKQVLAIIAFTPSRQKELRAVITKA